MGSPSRETFPLLEGEEAVWEPADAAHWAGVYRALVKFCRDVLAEDDVIETLDTAMLRRRLRHFEARLAFWEGRQELATEA